MNFDDLFDRVEPTIVEAFRAAVEQIKSTIVLSRVIDRLIARDIAGAVAAMQIEPEAFAALDIAYTAAFNAGGINFVAEMPKALRDGDGNRVVFNFGVRNPAGEQILRTQSAGLVTNIVEDQRQGIRAALESSLAAGQNPRAAALDIVGRINPATRRREGGVIGLSNHQIGYINRARDGLISGDPEAIKRYLAMELRDKRFDGVVRKALDSGKGLSAENVSKIVGRLSDKNLKLRGEMIARTETLSALGVARDQAMRQQIEAGKVSEYDIKKIWRSAGDNRVRHTHRALNGKSVLMADRFVSPSGALLSHPGDPDAPISETAGCRCSLEYKINYFAPVLKRRI